MGEINRCSSLIPIIKRKRGSHESFLPEENSSLSKTTCIFFTLRLRYTSHVLGKVLRPAQGAGFWVELEELEQYFVAVFTV